MSFEAKIAIYLSRKHRMQNTNNPDDDVVHLFKAFVTSRLHFEFKLSDFTLFFRSDVGRNPYVNLLMVSL